MDANTIAQAAQNGLALWEELKRRWDELKLPGSQYSPNDFLAALLAYQFAGTPEEIVGMVRTGIERLSDLKKDRDLSYRLIGSDTIPVLLLGLIPDRPDGQVTNAGRVALESIPEFHAVHLLDTANDFPALPGRPPATACPHCGHDFARCAEGAYAATTPEAPTQPQPTDDDYQQALERVAREAGLEPEELRQRVLQRGDELATPAQATEHGACPHVGSDGKCFKCTDDRIVECSDCDEEFTAGVMTECKNFSECEHLYCPECKDNNISEQGYCDDCSTVDCSEDNCGESIERGKEHHCSSPDCENVYCDDSAERLLNADGKCPDCSGEDEVECNGCEKYFTKSRLTPCKEEDCDQNFCDDCKPDNLSEQGYCEDCSTVECGGNCGSNIDRGTEHRCSNPKCEEDTGFCDDCAKRLLNAKGLCSTCSEEDEEDCDGCNETFTSSRLTACRGDGCDNAYCADCKEENLNNRKLCEDCRE